MLQTIIALSKASSLSLHFTFSFFVNTFLQSLSHALSHIYLLNIQYYDMLLSLHMVMQIVIV